MKPQFPEITKRRFLSGLSAASATMLLTNRSAAAQPMAMSDFGNDTASLQRAFDWAHEIGGAIVLDTDVTVRGTIFMGSVTLLDGGGRLRILADESFTIHPRAGEWDWRAAILMRSARGNSFIQEPLRTQYDVTFAPGVRVEFLRTHARAPESPFLFTGLTGASRIGMDFSGSSTGKLVCNGPDYFFFNRAIVSGRYSLSLASNETIGGFWFRDIDEEGLGPQFSSDFMFANPLFSKEGGADECVAIYTVKRAPGRLRARGSLEVERSAGLGFSILDNWKRDDEIFDVELLEVRVRSTTKPNQPVVKIRDSAPSIDRLVATFDGAEKAGRNAYILRCIRPNARGQIPRIGHVLLINGADTKPVPIDGACTIGNLETVGL